MCLWLGSGCRALLEGVEKETKTLLLKRQHLEGRSERPGSKHTSHVIDGNLENNKSSPDSPSICLKEGGQRRGPKELISQGKRNHSGRDEMCSLEQH